MRGLGPRIQAGTPAGNRDRRRLGARIKSGRDALGWKRKPIAPGLLFPRALRAVMRGLDPRIQHEAHASARRRVDAWIESRRDAPSYRASPGSMRASVRSRSAQ
jgi:hypothetical protein